MLSRPRTIPAPDPDHHLPTFGHRPLARSWRQARRLVLTAALAIAATAVTQAVSPTAAQANDYYKGIESAQIGADWMSAVPDNTSLARMSIPGTHETLALCGYSTDGDGRGCDPVSTGLTQTQEDFGYGAETLTTQLNAGIRSIDIRLRISKDDNGLSFTIHHGVYYQWTNFTHVLTKANEFLSAHRDETILLNLKAECTGEGTSCNNADGYDSNEWFLKILKSYLNGTIYTGNGDETRPATSWGDLFWQPSIPGAFSADGTGQASGVPTIGPLRGKIVMLGVRGPRGGIFDGYGISQLYPAGGSYGEYVQDEYDVGSISAIDDKWEKVRAHLRRTNGVWDATRPGEKEYVYQPDALYMNYTSGSSAAAYPYTVAGGTPSATGVNGFLYQCLRNTDDRCREFYSPQPENFGGQKTMSRTGIMMMDFPGGGLIDEIVKRNPTGRTPVVNGGVGDPMENHPGGDDGGPRPTTLAAAARAAVAKTASAAGVGTAASAATDSEACRPDGLIPTAGVATPYCLIYQGDGTEWLGQGRPRRVVAYFNGARTGADGTPHYLVKNIPWSQVTHINYAFATVENNQISVGASGPNNPATGMQWPGQIGAEMDPSLPYLGHFNLLTKYKKLHPRVKTVISVGGWAGSTGFYAMTTNADGSVNQGGIDTFAASVVDFLRGYGFDGVDIDFEYPTVLDDTGNPQDWTVAQSRRKGLPTAYTALMRTLRENLDRAAAADNHYYLLTSASSASGYLVRGMANQQGLRYQDYTNLMAYDYHGTWNDVVGPNAALYDDGKDPELSDLYTTPEYGGIGYFNTDWAMHYLRGALQAGRINIGVPYYTRGWKGVTGGTNGMWGKSSRDGCEPGTGIRRPCGDGAIGIDNIWHDTASNGGELGSGTNPLWHAQNLERNILPRYAPNVGLTPGTDPDDQLVGSYTQHWDPATRTSWLWNGGKGVFLSTEDEQGVDAIAEYVRASGAGGVMMWELGGDYACPATVDADHPCGMGYTLTTRLNQQLGNAGGYDTSRATGSGARIPSVSADVDVDLVNYPTATANLWPLQATVRVTNRTGHTIGGGKDTVLSFDLPASTSPLVKDGNWQTGAQGGQWKLTAGPGTSTGAGLTSTFHRISTTLDYCQIIPAGKSLDLPIIYYLPVTGPVNTTLAVGGTSYAPASEHARGVGAGTMPAGGCSAPAWDAAKVYNPSSQPVEQVTVVYGGKIWRAKWWTQGNVPGTGADADHEPWKYVGPAS